MPQKIEWHCCVTPISPRDSMGASLSCPIAGPGRAAFSSYISPLVYIIAFSSINRDRSLLPRYQSNDRFLSRNLLAGLLEIHRSHFPHGNIYTKGDAENSIKIKSFFSVSLYHIKRASSATGCGTTSRSNTTATSIRRGPTSSAGALPVPASPWYQPSPFTKFSSHLELSVKYIIRGKI